MKKKVLVSIGTRPEAIKMAPVINELRQMSEYFETIVVATAQHREMLDQVLEVFNISPDIDLDLMRAGQELPELTAKILKAMDKVLAENRPDCVIVQGDTTSTFVTALAAFYRGTTVAHVEAGLRTFDMGHPFPEEANRKLAAVLSDLHFAPTAMARQNLLDEGVSSAKIFVTGNTIVDALLAILSEEYSLEEHPELSGINRDNRLILVTAHRRENWGSPLKNICRALQMIEGEHDDVDMVFSVHLNPKVQETARRMLTGSKRIHLAKPLDYLPFVHLMNECELILTDSGGVQEEAPSLGKPVFILRKHTERPEGLGAGGNKIIGTEIDDIVKNVSVLLRDKDGGQFEPRQLSVLAPNPYGDGQAANRIVQTLKELL